MIGAPTGGVGPGAGPDDEIVAATPDNWRDEVARALAEGFTWFDSLTGVDEILRPVGGEVEQVRVIARFVQWGGEDAEPRGRQLHVRVPRDGQAEGDDNGDLASIVDLVVGAAWYEREVHDFFGVRFSGGDDRALLWHHDEAARRDAAIARHPLRKDALLSRRVEQPWPGAKDPVDDGRAQASRRRTLPPGVPDPDVLADPEASAQEIVASLSGGRVRRRR